MSANVIDIIDTLQEFHSILANYYLEQKKNFHDSRVIDLLEFLRKSEQFQERHILILKKNINSDIQFIKVRLPEANNENVITDIKYICRSHQPQDYLEVMSKALRNEAILKAYCSKLSKTTDNPDLQKLFSSICKDVNREICNLYSYNNLFGN